MNFNSVNPSSKARTDFQELRETTNPPVKHSIPNPHVVSTAQTVQNVHQSTVFSTQAFHELPETKQLPSNRVTTQVVHPLSVIEPPSLPNYHPPVVRNMYSLNPHLAHSQEVARSTQYGYGYPQVTSVYETPLYPRLDSNPQPNAMRDERGTGQLRSDRAPSYHANQFNKSVFSDLRDKTYQ